MNVYLSLTIDGNTAQVMAATKTPEGGVIKPLAFETQNVETQDNLNGIIGLTEDNRMAVGSLFKKILNKIKGDYEITGVYLGIMPRSLRGEPIEIRREFNGRRRITERDLELLGRDIDGKINDALITKYDNGYIRDGVETINVRNELADILVRRSLAVVMNTRLSHDYSSLVPDSVRIHAVVPTHVAIAQLVATEDQRVDGVISFHIGKQSSGLTYICNDMVMATAVVPFGFDHIIKDMSYGEFPEDKIITFVTSSKMVYKCEPNSVLRYHKEGLEFDFSRALDGLNGRIREIFSLGYERIIATLNLEELKVPVMVTCDCLSTPDFVNAISDLIEQDCILGNASDILDDDTFSAAKYIPHLAIINAATENCIEESVMTIVSENPEPAKDEPKNNNEEKAKPKKERTGVKKIFDRFTGPTLFNDEQ